MSTNPSEVCVAPDSAFWSYHQEYNGNDNPETLMIQCEEQDIESGLPIGTTWKEVLASKAL